jgi:hypothetical protein
MPGPFFLRSTALNLFRAKALRRKGKILIGKFKPEGRKKVECLTDFLILTTLDKNLEINSGNVLGFSFDFLCALCGFARDNNVSVPLDIYPP